MFELLEVITPDLVLLDIEMPEINGLDAMKQLKAAEKTAKVPVIFLTNHKDAPTEAKGFELGAVDFISKPFSAPVLLNRIKTHLDIEGVLRERMNKLRKLQSGMVTILATMVENRDQLTGSHVERTSKYIKIFLNAIIERGIYSEETSKWDMDTVVSSVRLHDIGKIVISDLLLNKQGTLTTDEFTIMKNHAEEGEKIIQSIIEESGDGYFLQNAKLFAGYHHERWDGTGYPRGLKGEEIPLQGRIMAIVDVYDALVSDRPYKKAFTHEKAREIIIEGKEKQFDPKLIDVFIEVSDLFEKVKDD
jgi:putative two-component system response regulator